MTHTPGPWRVGWNTAVVADVPIPDMRGSADIAYYGGYLVAESCTSANARLISAAPDLLDALRAAVARVEVANREGDPILSGWLPSARAAIATAEGRGVSR